MLSSRDLLARDAALGDARRVVGADELERDRRVDLLIHADAQQVDMDRLAAHRMALEVLDDDRRALAAVEGDLEDGAGVGERVAQRPPVDGERLRILAATVDHAGYQALAAEAAGGARALDGARADGECGCVGGHERQAMLAKWRLRFRQAGYIPDYVS